MIIRSAAASEAGPRLISPLGAVGAPSLDPLSAPSLSAALSHGAVIPSAPAAAVLPAAVAVAPAVLSAAPVAAAASHSDARADEALQSSSMRFFDGAAVRPSFDETPVAAAAPAARVRRMGLLRRTLSAVALAALTLVPLAAPAQVPGVPAPIVQTQAGQVSPPPAALAPAAGIQSSTPAACLSWRTSSRRSASSRTARRPWTRPPSTPPSRRRSPAS